MTKQNIADIPLAIVGMACRLPGADNLDEFWTLLAEGGSQLGQLPPERFDHEMRYHPEKGMLNKSYASIGGVVTNKPFDHQACPIPQRLIDQSHDVHLLLCEVAASACRHAGLDPFALSPSMDVGVYIGHTPPSSLSGDAVYARLIEQTAQYLREIPNFDELTGGAQDAIIKEIIGRVRADFQRDDRRLQTQASAYRAASVISEGFNLSGPSMCFDAACASSLRALGHAARALQLGEIDMAIVGGASYCHADTLVLFSQAQSVSANNGTCPFDNDADGLVAAEGYISVVLKTLDRAMADGDPIQAVIRRIGISSDGKGKSLWAPRAEGQVEAIHRAYGQDLSLNDLQYIEMHATSTQVGDATEIDALTRVLKDVLPTGKKVAVGSVKANVGHTLESAGLTSLLKTVLAMQHATIPPQINIKKLNEKIDWENVPFYVPQETTAWPSPAPDSPRRAAVNAFGIGGLNVHVVLDEHLPEVSRKLIATPTEQNAATDVEEEGIAIIGMGAVLPGARTIDALWDVIHSGEDQKSAVPPERWDPRYGHEPNSNELWRVPTKTGGFISDFAYDWKRHKVPPKQISSADPLQFMLLDAADQALKNAGFDEREFDKSRTGVIVGTIFCGEFSSQLNMGLRLPEFKMMLADILRDRGIPDADIDDVAAKYEKILLKHMPALVDETGSFTSSTLASRITKTFDLMGGATAVDSGNTSAMSALASSIDLLRAGDCDMMLCATGHREMGLSIYEFMAKLGLLSQTDDPKGPFDADASGYVPGEGVGVVILKRLSDAQRDGDKIHGVIRGIAAARGETLEKGVHRAAKRSLEAARVSPEEIAVVESGSSGLPAADRSEFAGLSEAYASDSRSDELRVGALAGQIGNTCGAAGILEIMKAVTELNHGEIPGNFGPAHPADYVQANAKMLRLAEADTPVRVVNSRQHGLAGVSTYSQFDLAYHVVVEGGTEIPQAEKPQSAIVKSAPATANAGILSPWRIVRLVDSSMSALGERATQQIAQAGKLYEAADATSFQPADRFRLAIVAESADDLAAKLKMAGAQLGRPAARQLLGEKGIFYGETSSQRPKVAFVFPGQGSQYDGMLQSLVAEFAPAAEAMREVDAVLSRLNLPSFAELAWQKDNGLGSDVCRTQLSLLAADTIVYAAATAIGLRADRVAGHSFGELAALTAAGSWTFDEAILATRARCAAIDACDGDNGIMVSTSAPAETLDRLCKKTEGRVSVSHLNAPEQTVAGGDEQAVRKLAETAEDQGFKTKILDVPAAFHTPLMEGVKDPFRASLQQIPVEPPQIPLLSSVTNKYVADPADVRENLVVQMTQPVDWRGLAVRLANEGVTVVVEVGPRQVLTGLNRQALADRDLALVGCDHPKRSGMAQLLYARACVETTGALDSQSEDRSVRVSAVAALTDKSPAAEDTQDVSHKSVLNVDRLSGSPYEMGLQHGKTHRDEIRTILRRYADLAGSRWEKLFNLDDAVRQPEVFFGPQELEELRGIAKGADVTEASVIAHNLRLFYDAEVGGVHFALSAEASPETGLLHAANEDLSKSVRLGDCLARSIQVRRPDGTLPYVTFGVAGQVGSLSGINGCGLAISTATLADIPKESVSQQGRLHTLLVRQLLEQAKDIDSAVEIIHEFQTSAGGTWGLCISREAEDRVCYVEWDGTNLKVQPAMPSIFAANHRLLMNFYETARDLPSHSEHRLNRLKELLDGDRASHVSLSDVHDALRDRFDPSRGQEVSSPTINTIRRIDNQISVVMQPGKGQLWVTGGPMSNGHQNQFTKLDLHDLLPELKSTATAADHNNGSPKTRVDEILSAEEFADAYAVSPTDSGVCSRFVMRVVEASLPPNSQPNSTRNGPALILGDNAAAVALKQRLEQQGTQVSLLPTGDDIEGILSQLETICSTSQPLHLFLMTPYDEDAVTALDAESWNRRRTRGVMVPYLVCQRWYESVAKAKQLGEASLVAATTMGGDFGFSSGLPNVESGAIAGLLKGVALELKMQVREDRFRTKIVDSTAQASATDVAELLCRELAADDNEVEVGYYNGKRCLPRPVVESVATRPANEIPHGATFVITGGARGVTAVVARQLGEKYGAKLHLIGSSPVPNVPDAYLDLSEEETKELRTTVMKEGLANGEKPMDTWARYEKSLEIARTLKSFADDGIQATYHSCDISNRDALSGLLNTVRAADGPIQGVIHGAGFERACRFEKKQQYLVDRTIAAKVDGAAALMELTMQDPLRYFAAFGSVSGRFGGVGQTDYCVANEMVAKLIDWFRRQRSDCPAAVFHWHAWDDVGMAVRPESKHIAKLHNIVFMPSLEGVDHLTNEMRAGLPEGEIVITELSYCQSNYANEKPVAVTSGNSGLESMPMVDALPDVVPGESLRAEVILNPASDVFLRQHRYKGRPMMPVVMTLESLAEAASLLVGEEGRVCELKDIEILNGLRFLSDDPLTARLNVTGGSDGLQCEFTADFKNRGGKVLKPNQPYLRCRAEVNCGPFSPEAVFPEPPDTWINTWYPEDDKVIYHGPIFRTFRQFQMQEHDAWSQLIAPPADEVTGERNGDGWVIPTALLDGCFFASGVFLWCLIPGCVSIPAHIDCLSLGRSPRPGETCKLHIHFRGREGNGGIFDFALFGDDGAVILKVDGYENVIVYEVPAHASSS
ncbi:MAG: acyltransferase domain-containing protein [Planctomycetaceae bacterium]|jgi:acyl transferase domain-containing protein/NAD(P)-dependent dehydrogenase (short-subunit alcohol dehydrogenase family)|nr:acyltransferase domain-containing protein [Planctomycetaceae bacterium]MBT6485557.1 acyltransferase domain-containing protein [Planctomycetaceae bacterium]